MNLLQGLEHPPETRHILLGQQAGEEQRVHVQGLGQRDPMCDHNPDESCLVLESPYLHLLYMLLNHLSN